MSGISVSVSVGAKVRRSTTSAAKGVESMGVYGRTERSPYWAACRTGRWGPLAGRRGLSVGGAHHDKRSCVRKKKGGSMKERAGEKSGRGRAMVYA
jgi:hypothetical protein